MSLNKSIVIKECLDKIMSEFQCPVCLNRTLEEEQYQPLFCPNGHPCCTTCSARLPTCPCCRSTGGWSRSLPMERVAARFRLMEEDGSVTRSSENSLELSGVGQEDDENSVSAENAEEDEKELNLLNVIFCLVLFKAVLFYFTNSSHLMDNETYFIMILKICSYMIFYAFYVFVFYFGAIAKVIETTGLKDFYEQTAPATKCIIQPVWIISWFLVQRFLGDLLGATTVFLLTGLRVFAENKKDEVLHLQYLVIFKIIVDLIYI